MGNKEPQGKLGVMIVGLGAVATTFITGVLRARKNLSNPIGSLTQYDKIRVTENGEEKYLGYKDIIPLSGLDDLVFGAWDIFSDNAFQSAIKAKVLHPEELKTVENELKSIHPMKAVFDNEYVSRLHGDNVKASSNRWDMANQIREDIRNFRKKTGVSRIVVLWTASTEKYLKPDLKIHGEIEFLENAMKADDRMNISPSMCYAYASIAEGCPFIMGAPNTALDIPAIWKFAEKMSVPVAGKDFKTGQTLVKSGLAPIIAMRCLGLSGWFSTNILGNRDGLVLDEPDNFKSKEISKLSTLETILDPKLQPNLYNDYCHEVKINFYPPRNDNKESWDNIDIFGWMGYPMQIKINFLCRDSILAAPLCLDLVLLIDAAQRAGKSGFQKFLGFFFKSPMYDYTKNEIPDNNLYTQYMSLRKTICEMGGYHLTDHC
ncbi:MAG: inositol-3-phosphate synthase [Muribaculaceae bacterium]|nr:inositol-3-phosphate synthase [Muribaculaceae bacterium]